MNAWNSTFKVKSKPNSQSKWPFPNKPRLLKRSKLRFKGVSDTAKTKERIQALVRSIVILRDGGCILRDVYGVPACNGYRKDGGMIYQADHLVSRGNSATFGDTRLIVCVCKGHHGWKSVGSNLRKAEYDAVVKKLLSPQRLALWELAEAERFKPQPQDWALIEIALKQELSTLLAELQ